jgi:DNA-binding HxlR family transcriptional regulator
MERDGLVRRQVLKQNPPQHVEYSLTPLGLTLREPLAAVCAWATEHGADS